MEMASTRAEVRWTPGRIILVGTLGGMLSGMMMGATETFYGLGFARAYVLGSVDGDLGVGRRA